MTRLFFFYVIGRQFVTYWSSSLLCLSLKKWVGCECFASYVFLYIPFFFSFFFLSFSFFLCIFVNRVADWFSPFICFYPSDDFSYILYYSVIFSLIFLSLRDKMKKRKEYRQIEIYRKRKINFNGNDISGLPLINSAS